MSRPILIVGAARAISLVLGVVLLGLLGRRLGPGGFGILQFALAVMVYPILVVDLGLTTVGLREIAKARGPTDVIGQIVGARIVLATAATMALLLAVVLLPFDGESRSIFIALSLGLPASALNARWVLQGEHRFGRSGLVEAFTTAAQLALTWILVQDPADLPDAAIAFTVAAWAAAVLSIVLVGHRAGFRPRFGRQVSTLIVRGLPLGAAAIAITVYYSADTILLGIFRDTNEVAYYAAAYRIVLPILTIAGAVGTVAIPYLTSLIESSPAAADRWASGLCRSMIFIGLPIAIGGALAASPLIALVYGVAFAPAAEPLRILIWSVATVYGNAAFAFLLLARHADRRYLLATLGGAAINVGLNLVVIPVGGMTGAAITTIVSEVAVLSMLLWWARDVARVALPEAVRFAAFPSLVMAICVWPVKDSLAAVPVGIAAYGIASLSTGRLPRLRLG